MSLSHWTMMGDRPASTRLWRTVPRPSLLPQMGDNAYALIVFQPDAYTDRAVLTIDPAPDTVLRVFMAWHPLEEAVDIPPQARTAPDRTGFTIVERSGADIS